MTTRERIHVEAWQMREFEAETGRKAVVVDGMHELEMGSHTFLSPLPLPAADRAAVPAQRVGEA